MNNLKVYENFINEGMSRSDMMGIAAMKEMLIEIYTCCLSHGKGHLFCDDFEGRVAEIPATGKGGLVLAVGANEEGEPALCPMWDVDAQSPDAMAGDWDDLGVYEEESMMKPQDYEMIGKKLASLYSKNKMKAQQWFTQNKNTAIVDNIEWAIKTNNYKTLGELYGNLDVTKKFMKEMGG
jgi:hypothetical protein